MTKVDVNENTAITQAVNPETILPADPMINMIERIAMDPNSDLSKLERMLEMKERLEEKEARRAFDMAMAMAKSEIPPILKTGTVDYTNSKNERTFFKHETLDGIAAVVDPILSKHGLSYRYRSKQDSGQLYVTCVVAHRDGCSEETTLQGGPDAGAGKNNYQAIGSAATYLQRYTLKLALGLSAAKDDDGAEAGERGEDERPKRSTDPWTQTILSELADDSTDRDKAMAIAQSLCAQFRRMKGERQLCNEWDRRAHLIEGDRGLEGKHPDLHETVVDAYENRMNEIKESAK
ncbi:MAG: ERF family protein [Sulfitobacter sp.]